MVDGGEGGTRGASSRRWVRWLTVAVAGGLALVAIATAAWVLLLPDVEPAPLAIALEDPDLSIGMDDDGVVIEPADGPVTGTVVFYPGAGVPPAAYVPTWAPAVEDSGLRVIVPAVPLGLAVLDSDVAAAVRATYDDGRDGPWLVGGHSLGGAMAASFLDDTSPDTWDGLVLWAAYPAGDGLAARDDLVVVSVAGRKDGLTTVEEVEASRAALPQATEFRMLEGVSHAQFGAYGDQRGDGDPTVDDVTARRLIAEATVDGLAGLVPHA